MIAYVWGQVALAKSIDAVVVATDCLAKDAIRREADIYVNVQGDEPLIDPATIDACADCLLQAVPRGIVVSTGCLLGVLLPR